MKYKALVSFAGKITMGKGEVREISNKELISDLLKAKYIAPAEEVVEEVEVPVQNKKSKK